MAYGVKNINPLDLRPSTAIGVALPFSSPNVFDSVYTTQDQLKYNIINYLLTDNGERVFEPTFGIGLRRELFEQITDSRAVELQGMIRSGVENYFPNVQVVDIKVIPFTDQNLINITFTYNIINTGQTDQITINFENG